MIFVDSNVPMYLIGAPHPNEVGARARMQELITARERLVTDAEVFQEILHRYRLINRPAAIQPAFDALVGIVEAILPIERADMEAARDVLLARWTLAARDALHVAVMQRHGINTIFSFDRGFDEVPGITRVA